MRVGRLLLRRLLFMIPILFGVVTVTFFVTRLSAGDPAVLIAGPFASTETIETIQTQLGTDRPLGEQYITYLGNVVRLDFGTSFFTGDPVAEDLADRLPISLRAHRSVPRASPHSGPERRSARGAESRASR